MIGHERQDTGDRGCLDRRGRPGARADPVAVAADRVAVDAAITRSTGPAMDASGAADTDRIDRIDAELHASGGAVAEPLADVDAARRVEQVTGRRSDPVTGDGRCGRRRERFFASASSSRPDRAPLAVCDGAVHRGGVGRPAVEQPSRVDGRRARPAHRRGRPALRGGAGRRVRAHSSRRVVHRRESLACRRAGSLSRCGEAGAAAAVAVRLTERRRPAASRRARATSTSAS